VRDREQHPLGPLSKLEAAGILTKTADPADARRFNYRLTQRGLDLARCSLKSCWVRCGTKTLRRPQVPSGQCETSGSVVADIRQRWSAG